MGARARSSAVLPAAQIDAHSASASCSTPPSGSVRGCTGASAAPSTRPSGPTTTAFVAEVPWSIARTFTPGTDRRAPSADALLQVADHLVDRDAHLVAGVAIAHRDGLLVDRLPVDGDAEGRTRFVHARVAFA